MLVAATQFTPHFWMLCCITDWRQYIVADVFKLGWHCQCLAARILTCELQIIVHHFQLFGNITEEHTRIWVWVHKLMCSIACSRWGLPKNRLVTEGAPSSHSRSSLKSLAHLRKEFLNPGVLRRDTETKTLPCHAKYTGIEIKAGNHMFTPYKLIVRRSNFGLNMFFPMVEWMYAGWQVHTTFFNIWDDLLALPLGELWSNTDHWPRQEKNVWVYNTAM